ncbi:MAG: threonylcarbamoyl-AMP synthase [Puniceicoccales bacterium]|jgi:L-threonylcarbamoyladenylate synthase|nr:threonylcarbamoyl-AMP synthase [Puniceicoccales bacterium]
MSAPFFRDTAADLERVVALLCAGEPVALPTETVYGLAADALNTAAVRRIFDAKGRPLIDPLIVHVATLEAVAQIAEPVPELERLAAHFWPGPLTVVLRKKSVVPDLVTAGTPTVAVRMPAHPLMRKVLLRSGLLLAAPSANPFGYVSPTCAEHVRESLKDRAPWILDGGECAHGLESTILHLAEPDGPRLLRPGPVSREALEAVLGVPVADSGAGRTTGGKEADESAPQVAPGMLSRHYSPRTPVVLRGPGGQPSLPDATQGGTPRQAAVVWIHRPETAIVSAVAAQGAAVFWLSESADLAEAGHNVFALLRRLDAAGFSAIHLELTDGSGIGAAINDRLRRAAAK